MTAKIIELPIADDAPNAPPNCFNCVYACFGMNGGTWCSIWRDEVINERDAVECEAFERA